MVPWAVLRLIGRPTMPVAIVYLVLWQWAQTFARVLQTMADGEPARLIERMRAHGQQAAAASPALGAR